MATMSPSKIDESSKLPVEEKRFERVCKSGEKEMVPSLDKLWMTEVNFLSFSPPSYLDAPGGGPGVGGLMGSNNLDPLWVESVKMLDEDLHWLLQLEYHKFWSQVMYDQSLHCFLDSYLCSASRVYEESPGLPQHVQELLRSVHRKVFMVFLRMATHKENSTNFMSLETYSNIIYDYFLFDIPKLLDLCALYGANNRSILVKMVGNIFKRQPKYEQDWKVTVGTVMECLGRVEGRVLRREEGKGGAVRLDTGLSPSDFAEIVLYLADFAKSLRAFLDVYPQGAHSLAMAGFVGRMVSFYEGAVVTLQDNWHRLRTKLINKLHIKYSLRSLKKDMAWLVHEVLRMCYLSAKPQDSSGVRSKTATDDFISVVSDIVSERRFLKEYGKQFDLLEEVKAVQHAHPELPDTHFDYILSALVEDADPPVPTRPVAPPTATPTATPLDSEAAALHQSRVSQVKELLPHLGEGFIELCLKEFNNNPATVIHRVLEETLPQHLKNADFNLPASQPQTTPPAPPPAEKREEPEWSYLDQRANVYDDDEFDVLRRPGTVDLSRVHIGKKFDSSSLASVLDDKSHLDQNRARYKPYELETPWDYISEEQAAQVEAGCGVVGVTRHPVGGVLGVGLEVYDLMYEDEYDDTYDSQNVGAQDDATDEEFVVRRLNEKGRFSRQLGPPPGTDEDSNTGPAPSFPPRHAPSLTSEQSRAKQFLRDYLHNDKVGGATGGRGSEGQGSREDRKKVWRGDGKGTNRDRREQGRVGEGQRSQQWEQREQRHGHRDETTPSSGPGDEHVRSKSRNTKPELVEDRTPDSTGSSIGPSQGRGASKGAQVKAGGRGEQGKPEARGEPSKGSSAHSERRSRQLKDRHKSSQGNHNRKAMADKKRRGGML